MLKEFIAAMRVHLASLEALAEKDATAIEADIAAAKVRIEAELAALVTKLQNL
jgi:hypothetical protein